MSALYLSMTANGNDGVVRRPRATDAIGAALRGAFGDGTALPADLAQLLRRIDHPR